MRSGADEVDPRNTHGVIPVPRNIQNFRDSSRQQSVLITLLPSRIMQIESDLTFKVKHQTPPSKTPRCFECSCSPFKAVRFSVNFRLSQQNTVVIISNDICILKHNKTTLHLDEEWSNLEEKLHKNQVIKR